MFIFKVIMSLFTNIGWKSIKGFFVKRKAHIADITVILLIVLATGFLTTCAYNKYKKTNALEQVNAQQEQAIKDLDKLVTQTVQSGEVTQETTSELHNSQLTTEVKANEIVTKKESKIKAIKADKTTTVEAKAQQETIARLDAIQEAFELTVKPKDTKK